MSEILAYYRSKGHKNEPNAMKRGFAQAFGRFDAYQLAKYKGEGKEFSLIDVANLVHPVHTDAVHNLINGTLAPANTWETKLTQAGQKAEDEEHKEELKAQAWNDLVKEHKLGYFALLRNLRNIMEQAPGVIDEALKQLVDEKSIKKSLVLPFRFFTAYSEFVHENGPAARKISAAISKALEVSINNMPDFGENALAVVDHSASMDSGTSENSKATNFQIGALFGLALAKKSNADLMYFGDTAKYYNVSQDSLTSQIKTLDGLNEGWGYRSNNDGFVGHGTNFHAIFEEANRKYDRIFIFSDMQAWENYYTPTRQVADYKTRTGANPHIYTFDLSGYGSMQFPEQNVYAIAGFSDKVLDVIKLMEQDRNALVKKIEAVEL
jgi:60 kDa SS-A/Ro ribonucleoprotein